MDLGCTRLFPVILFLSILADLKIRGLVYLVSYLDLSDDALSASSEHHPPHMYGAHRLRVDRYYDTACGWMAAAGDAQDPWVQFDMGRDIEVWGVFIRERCDASSSPQRVTAFRLTTSKDGSAWLHASDIIFPVYHNPHNTAVSWLSEHVRGRYWRINIFAWSVHPSMKADLIGTADSSLEFHTNSYYDYALAWTPVHNRKAFVFSVRACNDAHVGLFSVLRDNSSLVYEIIIGGARNLYSFIRQYHHGPNKAMALTPGILSCTASRPFWISWQDGRIQVGRGPIVDADLFMQWSQASPDPVAVEAVSLSTGWLADGGWQVDDSNDTANCFLANGGCSHICTNDENSYSCSCGQGYLLDSDLHNCSDIDACTASSLCAHTCHDTPGSYYCTCRQGYELDSDRHACNNIDECTRGTHNCSDLCEDTDGAFRCRCSHGFHIAQDLVSCVDTNECETGDHECSGRCLNLVGTYGCYCEEERMTLGADCADEEASKLLSLPTLISGGLWAVVVLAAVVYLVAKIIRKRAGGSERRTGEHGDGGHGEHPSHGSIPITEIGTQDLEGMDQTSNSNMSASLNMDGSDISDEDVPE